jgi:acyl-CoA synthetase (AMP-forming)/AMP-acid ligase II
MHPLESWRDGRRNSSRVKGVRRPEGARDTRPSSTPIILEPQDARQLLRATQRRKYRIGRIASNTAVLACIERLSGQRIVERYGLTETLMNCSTGASGDRRPGYVGLPLPGVEMKLIADDGKTLESYDDEPSVRLPFAARTCSADLWTTPKPLLPLSMRAGS